MTGTRTDIPAAAPAAQEETIETSGPRRQLHEILAPVWAERKSILIWSAVVAVVVAILNFFVFDLTYKATTTLLPETEKGKLGSLSQFSGLAQLAGVSVPNADVSRLYPIILTSETILIPVIEHTYQTQRYKDPVDLLTFMEIEEGSPAKNMERAIKEMRGLITTAYDTKTSTVVVTLELEEQQLAADVLNAIVAEVDKFMRLKRINTATEQVRWITARLGDVEKELRAAEENLKTFMERNRRTMDSPQLTLEQQRLLREVTVKSTIAIELKKQYELAKIDEIKNTSIVNVLDPARPPVKKERPKRATNTVLAFIAVMVLMSGWFATKPVWGGRVMEFWQGVTAKEEGRR
jgi:tyrosine-protein kinase Etk/Wzc